MVWIQNKHIQLTHTEIKKDLVKITLFFITVLYFKTIKAVVEEYIFIERCELNRYCVRAQ